MVFLSSSVVENPQIPLTLNPTNPPHLKKWEALARQRHAEAIDNIDGISERAVHHLARDIEEQFNRTLGEILETENIKALPGPMLDELRAPTTDPLRLFDLDSPPSFARAINFDSKGLHDFVYSHFPLPGESHGRDTDLQEYLSGFFPETT